MNGKTKTTIVIVGLLVMGAVAAPGHVALEDPPASLYEQVASDLEREGVALDSMTTMTHFTPQGTSVQEVTMGAALDFLAAAQAGDVAPGGVAIPVSHSPISVGDGDEAQAAASGWFYCDYASVFVLHQGAPGDRIVSSTPSPVPLGANQVCSGLYGPSASWAEVTVDISNPYLGWGCGAAVVMLPSAPDGQVGSSGGFVCHGNVGTAHGNGSLTSIDYGLYRLDYFVGEDATITVSA